MSTMWGWHGRALVVLTELAKVQPYITSDDLYNAMEDDPPPHYNSIGSVFGDAGKMGILRDTGAMTHTRRASGKGRKITLWESPTYQGDRTPPPETEPVQQSLI